MESERSERLGMRSAQRKLARPVLIAHPGHAFSAAAHSRPALRMQAHKVSIETKANTCTLETRTSHRLRYSRNAHILESTLSKHHRASIGLVGIVTSVRSDRHSGTPSFLELKFTSTFGSFWMRHSDAM
ncbi:hypothetical protein BKA63DRAFT_496086 [Paraphoma chrysanthemicola]|nr:hypothetical protein BKA63DRAFT_496086 [Paraphoma chrysanthemicola]